MIRANTRSNQRYLPREVSKKFKRSQQRYNLLRFFIIVQVLFGIFLYSALAFFPIGSDKSLLFSIIYGGTMLLLSLTIYIGSYYYTKLRTIYYAAEDLQASSLRTRNILLLSRILKLLLVFLSAIAVYFILYALLRFFTLLSQEIFIYIGLIGMLILIRFVIYIYDKWIRNKNKVLGAMGINVRLFIPFFVLVLLLNIFLRLILAYSSENALFIEAVSTFNHEKITAFFTYLSMFHFVSLQWMFLLFLLVSVFSIILILLKYRSLWFVRLRYVRISNMVNIQLILAYLFFLMALQLFNINLPFDPTINALLLTFSLLFLFSQYFFVLLSLTKDYIRVRFDTWNLISSVAVLTVVSFAILSLILMAELREWIIQMLFDFFRHYEVFSSLISLLRSGDVNLLLQNSLFIIWNVVLFAFELIVIGTLGYFGGDFE